MLLDGNDPDMIQQAAALLAAGQLVAFPTETGWVPAPMTTLRWRESSLPRVGHSSIP